MTNRLTPQQLWDRLASGVDEELLQSADGELLGESAASERVDTMRQIVRHAMVSVSGRAKPRRPLIPRDPAARRELLRLLLGHGSNTNDAVSAAFSAEDELPDSGVEAELKRLLGRDGRP